MGNKNKEKGTRLEYDVMHYLEMIMFYCIRAYSSAGWADLMASPSWNPRGNFRCLLIQCKDSKKGDYIEPMERDHLDYLQQINSGLVLLVYKDKSIVYAKNWETGETLKIDEFIQKYYGIPTKYSEVLKKYKIWNRPIHMYPVPKEAYINRNGVESERPIASFADLYSYTTYYPHVPEKYKDKHKNI
ncbi:MAG: hypothetical protein GWN01_05540 [Nitrosopumilaceae archaeon]|nr:hypothetical protein [Nitrosopumilaceae archaeon]NIU86811.1 hypothetical protein [Nitrosopumilaceae archaeon]NIX61008.1 hypothetical protein [Nitrosopumilaceae archaeon]